MNNLISINDISLKEIYAIFERAKMGEKIFIEYSGALKDRVLASIFLQPSTRTQLSFQSAFIKLGGTYIGFSDINSSRSGPPYYEPLDDMAQIVSNYCDIIVMRTINATYTEAFLQGASVPIISAGSGNIEHPTQALTDLYTLTTYIGNDLSNLNILVIGTPRQRTINSFLLGLSNWNNINVHILCQCGIVLPDFVSKKITTKMNIAYYSSVNKFFESGNGKKIDVIYMDKIFNETTEYNEFIFNETELYSEFKKDIIILHPLPRTKELPKTFDMHPGAIYFNQAKNGLYVRASLFLSFL
ncbi:MAG: hypothetical protein ACI4EX_10300 [Lachnospiraceae bacterium]